MKRDSSIGVLVRLNFIQRLMQRDLLNASLFLAIGLMIVSCAATSPLPSCRGSAGTIRVGTYNVFTGTHDVPQTVKVIRSMNADVVALQELSPEGARLLNGALKRDYRYRKFTEGVAILSRFPMTNARYQHSKRGINGFLIAEVDSPSGRLQFASLHLDPLRLWTTRDKWTLPSQLLWGQADIHRAEVTQIHENLEHGVPTVIAGDFNNASRAALDEFARLGFTDGSAAVTPRPDRAHTLHFTVFGIRTGRRIDHILHDSNVQTLESRTLPGLPSDHDPVVASLSWKRGDKKAR